MLRGDCIRASGVSSECRDAFGSDEESSSRVEDGHYDIIDCSGYVHARDLFQEHLQCPITNVSQVVNQPASLQTAGQVPYGDQDVAHETSPVSWKSIDQR